MAEINTVQWGEFRVGDLFEIHPTKAYKETNAVLLDGGVNPVLANSAYNNGIGGYSSKECTEKGNMITFSDTVDANTVFYQPNSFIGYSHVQGLYPKGKYQNLWNKYSLLYFTSMFREKAKTKGFDYGNKFKREYAIELLIKLPITSSGTPDFEYMENYMKEIEKKARESIETMLLISKRINRNNAIDISKWKEFKVGDLFEIKAPATRAMSKYSDGEIPYVSSGYYNNGVSGYLTPLANEQLEKGQCITVSPLDGTSFYQPADFLGRGGAGSAISIMYNEKLNKYSSLFICSIIKMSAYQFDYSNALKGKSLKKLIIKLPATSSGEPDYKYMEDYMKAIELKAVSEINTMIS